mmetsp:Transcript_12938/g.15077  ORF Transcript_12938/g.15077 Transcript_12938/m.15077 type:complete len:103 (+) Transcript_12938:934-1242(+)
MASLCLLNRNWNSALHLFVKVVQLRRRKTSMTYALFKVWKMAVESAIHLSVFLEGLSSLIDLRVESLEQVISYLEDTLRSLSRTTWRNLYVGDLGIRMSDFP